MEPPTPAWNPQLDAPTGAVGQYNVYSFEQCLDGLTGGFDNDPNMVNIDWGLVQAAAADIQEAGNAMRATTTSFRDALVTLLGPDDQPNWDGDAANEFAALMFAVLTWLSNTTYQVGVRYYAIVQNAAQQANNHMVSMWDICVRAEQAYEAAVDASAAANPTNDYLPAINT